MQAIMETIFDLSYLVLVILLGSRIIKHSKENKEAKLFGIMAIILGSGDAFHLIPRVYALWTDGMEAQVVALGFGKLVTSITMTIFYLLLFQMWKLRYQENNFKQLSIVVYSLSALRIVLCLFPQNKWMSLDAPLSWGIYRNIPFVILGALMIVLFYKKAKEVQDKSFKFMWLAILISFGFYIPVVLWADVIPIIGMLMLPKTCAYVWMVWMGYKEYVKNKA